MTKVAAGDGRATPSFPGTVSLAGELPPPRKRRKRYLKQKTNFTGHPYTTRFILGALTKAMLHEREGVFDALMDATTDDLIYMATEGVKDRDGKPRWLFLLRATGDWPWLSKIAKLDRSFSNCVKKQKPSSWEGYVTAARRERMTYHLSK